MASSDIDGVPSARRKREIYRRLLMHVSIVCLSACRSLHSLFLLVQYGTPAPQRPDACFILVEMCVLPYLHDRYPG